MNNKIQNFINHIVFVVDKSGSMAGIANDVIKVFDNQIKYLAKRSQETNQETRVSVYLFDRNPTCIIYDMDVLRTPSLKGLYHANGATALIDASILAIKDLQKTPELYGDHSFLIYVITDGENTENPSRASELTRMINDLPENWTLGIFVPNQTGTFAAKQYGFPANNISTWNTSDINSVNETITHSTDQYFNNRASGIRGTKNLFKVEANFKTSDLKNKLDELSPSDYILLDVRKKVPIQSFVEGWKIPFRKGANYYQLTKPEVVQNHKQIIVQDKINGKVYCGTNARQLLNLPNYEVKVQPGNFNKFDIFVQSTSNNRALVPGTKLIIMK